MLSIFIVGRDILLCTVLNNIYFDFFTFNDNLFIFNHSLIFDNSEYLLIWVVDTNDFHQTQYTDNDLLNNF